QRWLLAALAALWIVLAAGRYAEVTAPALYGRDINLYWDLRFIPDVAAMVTRVAPTWLVLLVVATTCLAVWLLYRLFASAFGVIASAMTEQRPRAWLAAAAGLALILFLVLSSNQSANQSAVRIPQSAIFPSPVLRTYARQLRLVREARAGSRSIPPSPDMSS